MRPFQISIFGLMLLILGSGLAFAGIRYAAQMPVLAAFGVFLLFPGILAPIQIRLTHWQAAEPQFVPIDLGGPNTPPYLQQTAPGLKPLGFSHLCTWRLADQVPNVTGYVSAYFNPKSRDVAEVVTAIGTIMRTSLLAFASELKDGREIITSNSRLPPLTPPLGWPVETMPFPDVKDAGQLYVIHCARVADGLRCRPAIDDPGAYLLKKELRSLTNHVDCGYYYSASDGKRLRPTWKGATLMAWKALWPVPSIRRALRRWRAQAALRSLNLEGPEGLRDGYSDRGF